jgi:hypothetical protein
VVVVDGVGGTRWRPLAGFYAVAVFVAVNGFGAGSRGQVVASGLAFGAAGLGAVVDVGGPAA